jgi:hypothetical protein
MQKLLKRLITFWSQNLVAWVRDDRAHIRQLKDEDAARKRWHDYLRSRPP